MITGAEKLTSLILNNDVLVYRYIDASLSKDGLNWRTDVHGIEMKSSAV